MKNRDSQEDITSRWNVIERLFQFGCGIILASVFLSFSHDRFIELWPPTLSPTYYSKVLGILLLLEIIALLFRWFIACFGEMRMIKKYFEDFIPIQPIQVYISTIVLAVILGILGAFSNNIFVCSAILALYNCGDIWAHKIRNNQLKEAFQEINTTKYSEDNRREAWNAIGHFYLERPQLERSATLMFFSFVGLLLAQASIFKSSTSIGTWLECAAYIVILLSIAVGEFLMYRWRRSRDKILHEVYSF